MIFKFYCQDLEKQGKVWYGGARETHWAECHNGVTPNKTKEFLKSPCFLDLGRIQTPYLFEYSLSPNYDIKNSYVNGAWYPWWNPTSSGSSFIEL